MQKYVILVLLVLMDQVVLSQTNTFPATGNAGVGTLSPGAPLHIYHATLPFIKVEGGGSYSFIQFTDGTTSGYLFKNSTSSTTNGSNAGALYTYTPTGYDFQHIEGGLPRFTVKHGGNVGIGTSDPGAKLDVLTGQTVEGVRMLSGNSGHYTALAIGRTATEGYLGMVAQNDNFLLGAVAGDITLSNISGKLHLGKTGIAAALTVFEDKIGIGNTSPTSKLDLVSGQSIEGVRLLSGNSGYYSAYAIGRTESEGYLGIAAVDNNFVYGARTGDIILRSTYKKIHLGTDNTTPALTVSGANIGIGVLSPTEKLEVNGNIIAKKLTITQTGWSDYVFDKSYKLRSLDLLEKYIDQNNHLPGIPSAKEVRSNGISVGENQALLLEKIEELTLYVIELKKENTRMQKINQQINRRMQKLESLK